MTLEGGNDHARYYWKATAVRNKKPRTCKLAELVKEGAEAGALDHKDAVWVEAAAAADDIRGGPRWQHWRAPRREAAEQGSVKVQHDCQPACMLRFLQQHTV